MLRDNDVVHDPDAKKTFTDQTKQWSEMMGKHRNEEWEIRRLISKYLNIYRFLIAPVA